MLLGHIYYRSLGPGPCTVRSKLNKLEHAWIEGGGSRVGAMCSEVQVEQASRWLGGVGEWGRALCNEVEHV